MKYTIHGFKQIKAVEFGLDNDDLLILRYFVDFKDSGAMICKTIGNKNFYWIKYEAILEQLPILKIKKDSVYRRLKKMTKANILEHKTIKKNGVYSFYTIGKKYIELVSDINSLDNKGSDLNPYPIGNKSDTYRNKIRTLSDLNPEQNINLLKDSSIKDKSIKDIEKEDTHFKSIQLLEYIESITGIVGIFNLAAIKVAIAKHGYYYTKIAIEKAIEVNKCDMRYVNGILRMWAKEGYPRRGDKDGIRSNNKENNGRNKGKGYKPAKPKIKDTKIPPELI